MHIPVDHFITLLLMCQNAIFLYIIITITILKGFICQLLLLYIKQDCCNSFHMYFKIVKKIKCFLELLDAFLSIDVMTNDIYTLILCQVSIYSHKTARSQQ